MGTIANDGIAWREPAPDESVPRTVLLGTAPNGVTYAIDHARLNAGFVVFYSPLGLLPNAPIYTPIVATVADVTVVMSVSAWPPARSSVPFPLSR